MGQTYHTYDRQKIHHKIIIKSSQNHHKIIIESKKLTLPEAQRTHAIDPVARSSYISIIHPENIETL